MCRVTGQRRPMGLFAVWTLAKEMSRPKHLMHEVGDNEHQHLYDLRGGRYKQLLETAAQIRVIVAIQLWAPDQSSNFCVGLLMGDWP